MTWPNYSPACRKAVNDLLKAGGSLSAYRANKDYGSGPTKGSWAYRLEREIEKRFRVKHAVASNSGTASLQAAITATLGKPRTSAGEIIVSPYTFSASATAIILAGYTPVFADVDPHTYCISPETVKHVISRRTKAILPVHLFGQLADMRGLKAFGLPVIEDFCQAVGARNADGFGGTQGTVGAASCNGSKNIPAGECGFLTTNDDRIAHEARLVGNHAENFGVDKIGYNFRPNELTACVAWHGLVELKERNERRQELAAEFYHTIRYYKDEPRVVRKDHVYYCTPFTVYKMDRADLIKKAAKASVKVGAGYIQPPIYLYPAFRKYFKTQLYTVNELSAISLCLLYDLTPDKPISYAREVGLKIRKILYGNYGPV